MAMSLDQFKHIAGVILGRDADELRRQYIESFVDTESPWYNQRIVHKEQFADGYYCTGYLWDCLKYPSLIFQEQAIEELSQKKELLHVLWDLHSNERIYVKDYWKFPKDAVLLLSATDIVAVLEFLPDDIYVFDRTFDWSIVFTHEYTADQRRYCRLAKSK